MSTTHSASMAGQAEPSTESTHPTAPPRPIAAPLLALCAIARFHQIAADPATLAHQLGWSANEAPRIDDLLLAAQHLGLKAKRSRTTTDRLA
ncbi:MAG: type I secretion system permease/ATPase, partial [Hylemonella sp.]